MFGIAGANRKIPPSELEKIADKIPSELLENIKDQNLDTYDFKNLISWINTAPTSEAAQRRFQASSNFPALLNHIYQAQPVHTHKTSSQKSLQEAIDDGQSFYAATEQYLIANGFPDIKKRHLSRLKNIKEPYIISLPALNAAAVAMNINLFPADEAQLKTLNTIFHGLASTNFGSIKSEREYRYIMKVGKDEFQADKFLFDFFEAGLRSFKSSDYTTLPKYFKEENFKHINDTINWITNNIINPIYLDSLSAEEILQREEGARGKREEYKLAFQLLGSIPFRQLAEMNVDIHNNGAKLTRVIKEYDQEKSLNIVQEWQGKYPQATAKDLPQLGKFRIVPLTTRLSLNEEHEVMDHCIDNYAPHCIYGRSHVFSVRDETGKTYSTFELDSDGTLVQHQGYQNADPQEEEKYAVLTYIDAIEKGALEPNKNYNSWRRAVDEEEKFSKEEISGYFKNDVQRADLAFKTLSDLKILPSNIRAFRNVRAWVNSALPQPKPSCPINHRI